jgi:hypothetical protein
MNRDEYIAVFKTHIAHPFGGNGAPSPTEVPALFGAFLELPPPPPWKPTRWRVGEHGATKKHPVWVPAWNEDELAVLKVACFVEADLEKTAASLGRWPMVVLKQAFKFRPRIIPVAWAKAYPSYENRK